VPLRPFESNPPKSGAAPLLTSSFHRVRKARRKYLPTFTTVESTEQLHGALSFFISKLWLDSCPDYMYIEPRGTQGHQWEREVLAQLYVERI